MKPKKNINYSKKEILELAKELRNLKQNGKNPIGKNIEISNKQTEDSKLTELNNISNSQHYDNSFGRKTPSLKSNQNNKKPPKAKVNPEYNLNFDNLTKSSKKSNQKELSIGKNKKNLSLENDEVNKNNLEEIFIQPNPNKIHPKISSNIFRPTRIKKDTNLYHIYSSYKNKINHYLYKNKDNVKLFGNYKYTNKTPDYYFKQKLDEEEEEKEKEKLEKEKEDENDVYLYKKDEGKIYDLTPLPAKSRKKMKSNYEKNEFYEGERAAVAMRRLEYNRQFNLRQQKIQENKLKPFILKITLIQRWWRNMLAKLYFGDYAVIIQKYFRGYLTRKKLNDILKNQMIENALELIERIYFIHWLKIAFDKIRKFKRDAIKINKIKKSGFNEGYYISKDYLANDVLKKIILIQSEIRMFLIRKKIKKPLKDNNNILKKIPKINNENSLITKEIKSNKDEFQKIIFIQTTWKEITERTKKKFLDKIYKKPKSSNNKFDYIAMKRIRNGIKKQVIKPSMMTKTIKIINQENEDNNINNNNLRLYSKIKPQLRNIDENPEYYTKKNYQPSKYLNYVQMIQNQWKKHSKEKEEPKKINKNPQNYIITKENLKKIPTLILPKKDDPSIYKKNRIMNKDSDLNNIILIQDEWKKHLHQKLNNDKTNIKVIKLNKDFVNNEKNYISKEVVKNVDNDIEFIQKTWKKKRGDSKEREIEPIQKNIFDNTNQGYFVSKVRNKSNLREKNNQNIDNEEILKIPKLNNNNYISKEYKNKIDNEEEENEFIENITEIQETYKKYRIKKVKNPKNYIEEDNFICKPLISNDCYIDKNRSYNIKQIKKPINENNKFGSFITKSINKKAKDDLDKIKLIQKEFREYRNKKRYINEPKFKNLELENTELYEILNESKDGNLEIENNQEYEIMGEQKSLTFEYEKNEEYEIIGEPKENVSQFKNTKFKNLELENNELYEILNEPKNQNLETERNTQYEILKEPKNLNLEFEYNEQYEIPGETKIQKLETDRNTQYEILVEPKNLNFEFEYNEQYEILNIPKEKKLEFKYNDEYEIKYEPKNKNLTLDNNTQYEILKKQKNIKFEPDNNIEYEILNEAKQLYLEPERNSQYEILKKPKKLDLFNEQYEILNIPKEKKLELNYNDEYEIKYEPKNMNLKPDNNTEYEIKGQPKYLYLETDSNVSQYEVLKEQIPKNLYLETENNEQYEILSERKKPILETENNEHYEILSEPKIVNLEFSNNDEYEIKSIPKDTNLKFETNEEYEIKEIPKDINYITDKIDPFEIIGEAKEIIEKPIVKTSLYPKILSKEIKSIPNSSANKIINLFKDNKKLKDIENKREIAKLPKKINNNSLITKERLIDNDKDIKIIQRTLRNKNQDINRIKDNDVIQKPLPLNQLLTKSIKKDDTDKIIKLEKYVKNYLKEENEEQIMKKNPIINNNIITKSNQKDDTDKIKLIQKETKKFLKPKKSEIAVQGNLSEEEEEYYINEIEKIEKIQRNYKLRSIKRKKLNDEDKNIQKNILDNCEFSKEYGIDLNDKVNLIQKTWKNYIKKENENKTNKNEIMSKCQVPYTNSYITKDYIQKEENAIKLPNINQDIINKNNYNYISKEKLKDELPNVIYLQNKIKDFQNKKIGNPIKKIIIENDNAYITKEKLKNKPQNKFDNLDVDSNAPSLEILEEKKPIRKKILSDYEANQSYITKSRYKDFNENAINVQRAFRKYIKRKNKDKDEFITTKPIKRECSVDKKRKNINTKDISYIQKSYKEYLLRKLDNNIDNNNIIKIPLRDNCFFEKNIPLLRENLDQIELIQNKFRDYIYQKGDDRNNKPLKKVLLKDDNNCLITKERLKDNDSLNKIKKIQRFYRNKNPNIKYSNVNPDLNNIRIIPLNYQNEDFYISKENKVIDINENDLNKVKNIQNKYQDYIYKKKNEEEKNDKKKEILKKPLFNNDENKNNNSYITKEYKNNKIKEIKTIPESFEDNLIDVKNKDDNPLKKNSLEQCYLSKTVLLNNEDKLIPLQRHYKERNKLKNKNNENDINNITHKKPYEIINKNEYITKERKSNNEEKIKPIQRSVKKYIYKKDIKQEIRKDIIYPSTIKKELDKNDSLITKIRKDQNLDIDKIIHLQRQIKNHLKEYKEPFAKPINLLHYYNKTKSKISPNEIEDQESEYIGKIPLEFVNKDSYVTKERKSIAPIDLMNKTKKNIIKSNRRYVYDKLIENDKSLLKKADVQNKLGDMFRRDIPIKLNSGFNQTYDRLRLFYFIYLLKQRVLKDNQELAFDFLKQKSNPKKNFNPDEEAKESFYFKTIHRHLDLNTPENLKNLKDERVKILLEDTTPAYFRDDNEYDENIIPYINEEQSKQLKDTELYQKHETQMLAEYINFCYQKEKNIKNDKTELIENRLKREPLNNRNIFGITKYMDNLFEEIQQKNICPDCYCKKGEKCSDDCFCHHNDSSSSGSKKKKNKNKFIDSNKFEVIEFEPGNDINIVNNDNIDNKNKNNLRANKDNQKNDDSYSIKYNIKKINKDKENESSGSDIDVFEGIQNNNENPKIRQSIEDYKSNKKFITNKENVNKEGNLTKSLNESNEEMTHKKKIVNTISEDNKNYNAPLMIKENIINYNSNKNEEKNLGFKSANKKNINSNTINKSRITVEKEENEKYEESEESEDGDYLIITETIKTTDIRKKINKKIKKKAKKERDFIEIRDIDINKEEF